MRVQHTLALALGLFVALGVQAQVHRCKDATGKLVFSDRPCEPGQAGELVLRKRTQEEILQERLQASEANERKYRARSEAREDEMLQQQRTANEIAARPQAAAANPSQSRACQEARKELEFVSSIRTVSQDEKRMRTNAAITNVNAACGSSTQLMQEPPKIIVQPRTYTDQRGRVCTVHGATVECH